MMNRALARKYFPKGDALGKRITLDDPRHNPRWMTIVGIVGDIHHRGLDVDPRPEYYLPHTQMPAREMIPVARSNQDPRSLASSIRREIQSIDPDEPVANIRTLDTVVADSVAPRRLAVVLLGVFAGIALLLSAVGIYGVISYLVVQRTHEIGVRMALGALPRDVLGLVLRRGMGLVLLGGGIGLSVSVALTRLLAGTLYGVSATDPLTFAAVTALLAGVALAACYVPARRAARGDPMEALRYE
jgi:putative ABC transport system permease protein